MKYILETSGLGLKNRELNFDFWGRAQNIGLKIEF
jgi:hypothetical protein